MTRIQLRERFFFIKEEFRFKWLLRRSSLCCRVCLGQSCRKVNRLVEPRLGFLMFSLFRVCEDRIDMSDDVKGLRHRSSSLQVACIWRRSKLHLRGHDDRLMSLQESWLGNALIDQGSLSTRLGYVEELFGSLSIRRGVSSSRFVNGVKFTAQPIKIEILKWLIDSAWVI